MMEYDSDNYVEMNSKDKCYIYAVKKFFEQMNIAEKSIEEEGTITSKELRMELGLLK